MVSAWQDEQRGFGLVVPADELDRSKKLGRRPLKGLYERASLYMARTKKVSGVRAIRTAIGDCHGRPEDALPRLAGRASRVRRERQVWGQAADAP